MNKDFKDVEAVVSDLLSDQPEGTLFFHNLDFVKRMVEKTNELLENTKDSSIHRDKVLLAAWFSHVGLAHSYNDHIPQSCASAAKFLKEDKKTKIAADDICELIKALWSDAEPRTLEVEILEDAKTHYYASENLEELLELYRMELQEFKEDVPTQESWRKKFIEELRTEHRYYTDYAEKNWQEQKEKNLVSLVSSAAKAVKTKKKEKLKAKFKNESPERAIQSLFRTQLRNHIKLSDIADTKANILLSVNAIIISLLLANLIPKLDDPKNSYLIYPTVIFVIFSIASIIMSVLATRPKIENEKVVENTVDEGDTNYLFFGNFYALELQDFKNRINQIIQTKESVYESLTMDLYYLGVVLKKKYQLLRWTYTIFIIGILLSVLAFAIALKYFGMDQELLDAVTPEPQ